MPVKRTAVLIALLGLAVVLASSLPLGARPAPRPPAKEPAPSVRVANYYEPAGGEPSIDDLIGKLATIRAQKAALEKAEELTVALLKTRLKQQSDRIQKLGGIVEEAPRTGYTPVAPPTASVPVTSY
jgi:hypothetical protein